MLMLGALIAAVLISFSFKIVEWITGLFDKRFMRYTIYIWGFLLIAASLFIKENYVFHLPRNILTVLPLCLVILPINLLISRRSGYSPIGLFNRINFVITYPVFEEISFRGLILPILVRHQSLGEKFTLELGNGLFPNLSLAVIITAVLFAVSHLQYYKLNAESTRFMLFAVSGGLFFGVIAQATESILLTILLHIAFNGSAALYAYSAAKRQRT
ncbi:hypothetical protein PAECIP111892_03161 [Paenibacillus auburnensis]|uniref:CAAX prenyl protease 2/Lysostaphin resistance protein A-like domain-containing protein n=1 Tax=Paenibacillus auburnensis TaxID=2905649 RepID=A0ABM9CCI3_9BACL|nr:CPBP family intramembrane glutamic endopeptidase [Paenibacillus auburnensis]CAH1208697.1 hypothetical protein PAECIP111892_03161 [Paenibacillus auburnensis]